MERYFELPTVQKVVFFIFTAEKCLQFLTEVNQVEIAKKALNCCINQVLEKNYDGEMLYSFLDNEENGLTVFEEMSDNETESAALNCIIDAVAYTCRYAYDSERVNYYPEPISLVDDSLVDHFKNSYYKCFNNYEFINNLISTITDNSNSDVNNIISLVRQKVN